MAGSRLDPVSLPHITHPFEIPNESTFRPLGVQGSPRRGPKHVQGSPRWGPKDDEERIGTKLGIRFVELSGPNRYARLGSCGPFGVIVGGVIRMKWVLSLEKKAYTGDVLRDVIVDTARRSGKSSG